MKLEFDFNQVSTTEFGVGRDEGNGDVFSAVPVDGSVQAALNEVAKNTWQAMQGLTNDPAKYEPTEKYASSEHLFLPLDDDMAKRLRDLHEANNLPTNPKALDDPEDVFCYYARVADKKGNRITCLRRSTQFKGLLKSRLIRLVSDAFRLVEDRVFKIDSEFDLIVDAKNVHILRPSGFEFAGRLQDAVLGAVPETIKSLQHDLKFVDFGSIGTYAGTHTRAARYLASIRSQKETKDIDKAALKKLCKNTGVEIHEVNGKLSIPEEQIMGFLEVLDRRRYEIELIKASPERFRASSRRKLETKG
jgi:hypothetical protein